MLAQTSPTQGMTSALPDPVAMCATRQTQIGWIAAAWRNSSGNLYSLCRITIGHPSPADALLYLRASVDCAVADALEFEQELLLDRLARHADGELDSFEDVAVDLDHLALFAKKVVKRCRKVPAGQTMTYAQLAAACGSPKAARAVGNVMASNRYPLVVPCHRVVGSGGGLGGFSAPQGTQLKRQLLKREGVDL